MAPLGLLYVLRKRKYIEQMDSEIYLLAVASFIFVALNIVLPVLSTEYGIYRALLQSLFIMSFLIVVATAAVGDALFHFPSRLNAYMLMQPQKKEREGITFPLIVTILFFLYGTAFLPQLFGGNSPLLHLNNSGRYYDTYLIRSPGNSAVSWLANYVHNNPDAAVNGLHLEIDHSSVNQFISIANLSFTDGIFPGMVRKDAYVFVTKPTYAKGRSTIGYKGDQVVYSYPIQFLDDNKNLLYDNGAVRIYH
jgi:uncharacterized membrane protein